MNDRKPGIDPMVIAWAVISAGILAGVLVCIVIVAGRAASWS